MALLRSVAGLICAACMPLLAAAQLTAVDQTLSPGEIGIVALVLQPAGSRVAGLQIDLLWDSAMLEVSVLPGERLGAAGKLLAAAPLPGGLRCMVIGLNQTVLADGELLRLAVRALPSAPSGKVSFRIAGVVATDPEGSAVEITATAPAIQVSGGGAAPLRFTAAAVLNAASLQAGAISPGEMLDLSLFGLSPLLASAGIFFDELPAPVIATPPAPLRVTVPSGVVPGSTIRLSLRSGSTTLAAIDLPVRAASPGIFSLDGFGVGQAAILNQDGTGNTYSTPAERGSIVSLFATGVGSGDPLPVTIEVGGADASVTYAGPAPSLPPGVVQVNFQVPAATEPGPTIPVVLRSSGASSQNGVTLSVH